MTEPDEKEIFDCIDWSTESNYTGYEDEEDLDDEYDEYAELAQEFDALLTDVNMGT